MKIILVQYSSNFGGSTISGEMIARAIVNQGWELDVVFGFAGPFVDRMCGPRCETHVVTHRNWLRSPGLVRFVRNMYAEKESYQAMIAFFRKAKPDLVYVNSLVSYAAVRAAYQLCIPVVWHIRELFSDAKGELHWPAALARPWIRRFIHKNASAIVINSNTVRRNVLGAGAGGQIHVIPNGVPDLFFEPRESVSHARQSLGLPTHAPVVGFPGTLRPVKGHHVFLQAIPQILADVPECMFVITGAVDSSFAHDLVSKVQNSKFSRKILFTGTVADMHAFYRACNVCCIASESESFGRTAIESFASRTPLASTDSGGLSDIVQHDNNCLVFDYCDSEMLAGAVIELLKNKTLANRLSEGAFEDVRSRFSETTCASGIISVIERTARPYLDVVT